MRDNRTLRARVLDDLARLAPDQRRFLELRYGIEAAGSGRARALKEVATMMGLTEKQAHTLEERALRALRGKAVR